ncbi:MAG: hypothetical protein U1F43_16235 [Myxococcota bacterium]
MQRGFEAIDMARRVGDRRTLLDVIHVAFGALIEFAPPPVLEGLLQEVLALAGPADQLIALRARLRAAFIAFSSATARASTPPSTPTPPARATPAWPATSGRCTS